MKKTAIIICIAVLILCRQNSYAVDPGKDEDADTSGGQSAQDAVQHSVSSFDLEGYSNKGAKEWEVKGESATMVQKDIVKMDNIVANAYGEGSQATITADKGTYDKSKNLVKLQENVKATLNYSDEVAKQSSDFSIDMGDLQDESAKAIQQSTAQDENRTVITCEGEVEFDYQNNVVYFRDAVRVESPDGLIEADKITVHLEPKTRKINTIDAEGSVRISRGANITYSEKATYIQDQKRIILSGKPKLVFYQREDFVQGMIK